MLGLERIMNYVLCNIVGQCYVIVSVSALVSICLCLLLKFICCELDFLDIGKGRSTLFNGEKVVA
jgi:hypothetical protein